jgi:DNA topoisomerase I
MLTTALLSKSRLVPNEGKMSDPAHPAIYPTGVPPRSKLGGPEFKIYDLIVRRFLATFGDPAASQRTEVLIDIAGHQFVATGAAVLYDGWMMFYRPYVAIEESMLPPLSPGDLVENMGVEMAEKFTQPPMRYNQASLLAKMEQERIGTKATRADTIATLLKRNYVSSSRNGVEAADLGHAVIEAMREYSPSIISTSLTREMEADLEKVGQGKADPVLSIEGAVDKLLESLLSLVEKELEVGGKIGDARTSDSKQTTAVGPCPVCGKGMLRVVTSRKSKKRFVGCSGYSSGECSASAPLPQRGRIRPSGKACSRCGWPIIGVMFARRSKMWRICVNMACPSKKEKQVQQV